MVLGSMARGLHGRYHDTTHTCSISNHDFTKCIIDDMGAQSNVTPADINST